MNSDTSKSTVAERNCSSRSSPNAKNAPPWPIATNLPFSEWGTGFPDPRLVAAIVDRVIFNAHILETGTKS
ncbi:ATP-binding protein [Mycolicibacterium sp. Dal123E01]|uniref:ATP-binding protein n=1 Tax=Mycolicibacterium sp. Dal123E01 TaxID=3457578 RepID=UPI00403EEC05